MRLPSRLRIFGGCIVSPSGWITSPVISGYLRASVRTTSRKVAPCLRVSIISFSPAMSLESPKSSIRTRTLVSSVSSTLVAPEKQGVPVSGRRVSLPSFGGAHPGSSLVVNCSTTIWQKQMNEPLRCDRLLLRCFSSAHHTDARVCNLIIRVVESLQSARGVQLRSPAHAG